MSPKKCEIPGSTREKIICLRELGKSYRDIGKKLKLSFSTVRSIIKKVEETGSTKNKPRSGRPVKVNDRERRHVVKMALRNPTQSARNLANDFASTSGKSVTPQTIRNVLHMSGLRGRRPRKKPFISEVNRKKRLEFALTYRSKPMEFWKQVIFSDENYEGFVYEIMVSCTSLLMMIVVSWIKYSYHVCQR
nr:uncharacterized protein LOC122270307 [Parasteatoda tepidariorum]